MVYFDGTPAIVYKSWSASRIQVTVPPGATTGFVTLSIAGGTETGPTFTVVNAGSTIYSYQVPQVGGYDATGNVKQSIDSVMGTWNYQYDTLNRLTSAVPTADAPAGVDGLNLCMKYDSFGNRTQQNNDAISTWANSLQNPQQ